MQLDMEILGKKDDKEVGTERVKNSRPGRWFIGKAYGIGEFGIVTAQLLATGAISAFMMLNPFLARSIGGIPYNFFGFLVAGFGCLMLLLHVYQHKTPHNLILLAAFNLIQSLVAGTICSSTDASIVLQALGLTTAAVIPLIACIFWAVKRGNDFSFLGPILIQMVIFFVAIGIWLTSYPTVSADLAYDFYALGGVIFGVCIFYHTAELIKRLGCDQYTSGSVVQYLDIVSLSLETIQFLHQLCKKQALPKYAFL